MRATAYGEKREYTYERYNASEKTKGRREWRDRGRESMGEIRR